MCGLAALLSLSASVDPGQALARTKALTDAIRHRGPDSDGHWQDPDFPGLVLGHRRLSIIDLSPLGHQPMASASGRYWCAFNGEIYNYQQIETELRSLGHVFKGRSDTEVFLNALDQWGINQTLQKIGGMFAFAIWDRKARTLHLIRDRMGKKPIYVGWAGSDLIVSSELKSFHTHPAFSKAINRDVLALYMKYGYVHAPFSIYDGVWMVPPGARLALDAATLKPGENLQAKMEYYWQLPRVIEEQRARPNRKPDSEIIDEFESILELCVSERMISDVPLGAFLSGGIDSSTVVALMQKLSSQPVKTYAIGFDDAKHNEAHYAREIASHLGTDHHEMILSGADALAVVPMLPSMYDEPFADSSQIPTYLVSKFARQDVTVALSGDGGDEMLGGYNRHFIVPRLWAKIGWLPLPLRRVLARAIDMVPPHQWDKLSSHLPMHGERMLKLAGLLRRGNAMEVYDYLMSACADLSIVPGAAIPMTPVHDPAFRVPGLSSAEDMMARDTLSYLPNDILVKVDRASMAVSLEARAPLLDRRVFDYVWTLPLDLKIRNGKGKWLLRQVLERHVPRAMFDRPKQGFAAPVGKWLREDLKDWASDLLEPTRMRADGYLDAGRVQDLWTAHQDGRRQASTELWTILMFQAWRDRWK